MPSTLRTRTIRSKRPQGGTSPSSHGGTNLPREEDGGGATLEDMRRERILDIAIPLVVFGLTVALIAAPEATESGHEGRRLDALAVVLAALSALPLVLRRRSPLLAFALSTAASAMLFALDYPPGPPIGPTVAVFFVALRPADSRRERWLTLVVVVALFAAHIAANGIADGEFPGGEILLGAALWGGVWFAGQWTRLRRQQIAELEERALRAEREAERERQLAAAEERTRIARDLHDSAGHAINVILVHAGAARLLAEKDPGQSREALGTIETVARETLREIDQLVRALREDEDAVEPPGLAGLDTLVKRHRDAGLDVDVLVDGARRPLGPAVDQAAYRILQESLTNALRHGNGRVEVALTYGGQTLEIGVTNPSATPGPAAAGHGIVGMRERASLLGGSVSYESMNGVFRVRARLPYGGTE
jgi:signal transduction histidine kinase